MTTWEDLDAMVEGDPLVLRDRAWREIRTRDLKIAELEAHITEQNQIMREQGTELRDAEREAYERWCADLEDR